MKDVDGALVLVRADASPQMGGGHVLRCLALADALARRGARVAFACASIPSNLAARVRAQGHSLHRIEPVPTVTLDGDWEQTTLAGEQQQVDARRALQLAGDFAFVVLDHYQMDGAWMEAVDGPRTLVIDDLANRAQTCDVLVDQTLGRSAAEYSALVPRSCRVLVGPRYALLRAEFPAARGPALEKRRRSDLVRRVLISMGTTDVGGVTARALTSVLDADVKSAFDVVIGAGAPSLQQVRATAKARRDVTVHVDREEMATLLSEADVAVGAGGTSSWERCCLGLPGVTLAIAANQRLVAHSLAGVGATVAVDEPEQLGVALADLVRDDRRRAQMVAAAAAITDGNGAELVARELVGGAPVVDASIRLRRIQDRDSEMLWLWRNDPVTRSMAKSTAPVPWSDHERWFRGTLRDPNTQLFIGEAGADAVGMVRFDRVGAEAIVSINVSPGRRGEGAGTALLLEACAAYEAADAPDVMIAEIRRSNVASLRAFDKARFLTAGGDGEFVRMVRTRDVAHRGEDGG